MGFNPARLLGGITKGNVPMPEDMGDKATMRLVLLAIIARADNDSGEIPAEHRVPTGEIAADVGHKATAAALKVLEYMGYIEVERRVGKGACPGIRLLPKLAEACKYARPPSKRGRRNRVKQRHEQPPKPALPGQDEQPKPALPRQGDQPKPAFPGHDDQPKPALPGHDDQPKPALPGHDDQQAPYSTTLDPEGQLGRGEGSSTDRDCHDASAAEVIAAIDGFYKKGGPDAANVEKLLSVLRRATPETIATVPPFRRSCVQDTIWERTSIPRAVWKVKSTYEPAPSAATP